MNTEIMDKNAQVLNSEALKLQLQIELEVEKLPQEQQEAFNLIQSGLELKQAVKEAGVKQAKAFLRSDKLVEITELIARRDGLLNGVPIQDKRAILMDVIDKASNTNSNKCNLAAVVSATKLLAVLDKNIVTSNSAAGAPQVILNITELPTSSPIEIN